MRLPDIYIAPRNMIVFGAELFWLSFSTVALVVIQGVSVHEPLSLIALFDRTVVIVMLYVAIFYLMDLYAFELLKAWRVLLLNLIQAAGLICIAVGTMELFTRLFNFDPLLVLAHVLVTGVFAIGMRTAIVRTDNPASTVAHVAAMADKPIREAMEAENVRHSDLGLRLFWIDGAAKGAQSAYSALSRALTLDPPVRRVCVDPEILKNPGAICLVQTCRACGLQIDDLWAFAERTYGKTIVRPGIVPALGTLPFALTSKIADAARRARDLVIACLALIITLPLSLLTIVAIRWDSSGPAFFRQERIGENRRPFTMLKFRSMYQDLKPPSAQAWTTHDDDPRITRVGRIIRKFHLDELPQLINVIRGEMSLIGPRPFHPTQATELETKLPCFGLRYLVKPGITGWAQIRCGYETSVENQDELFARDLYYIKHMSFAFDLEILLETVRTCVWRRGAR